jgi:hypothetical protein
MIFGLFITRAEALATGFNYEGTHFGVPVWCEYDDHSGEIGHVDAKCALLEPVLTLGVYFTQFCNLFREPGDEFLFAFCIAPIESSHAGPL